MWEKFNNMDNRGSGSNHTKLLNSNSDFDSVHSNEVSVTFFGLEVSINELWICYMQVIKLMTLSNYSVNDQPSPEGSSQKDLDRDRYGDTSHHSFVTVIPVDYPRQKFPNTVYSTQNYSSQEDIRSYVVPLADKDHSEMSSVASLSTQSSHVINRGMCVTASADRVTPPRVPNGQCK